MIDTKYQTETLRSDVDCWRNPSINLSMSGQRCIHEPCRAGMKLIVEENERLRQTSNPAMGNLSHEEELRDKDEIIRRKNEEISSLKRALNQAELQIWNNENHSRNTSRLQTDSASCRTMPHSQSESGMYGKTTGPLEADSDVTCCPSMASEYFPSVKSTSKCSEDSRVERVLEESRSMKSMNQDWTETVPPASQIFVNKLISQNIKIKQMMKDLLQIKGMSLTDYLNAQEYEDIIEQQKLELNSLRLELLEVKKIIEGRSDLEKQCTKQIEMISDLKRSVAIQKALAESFSAEYEKVKEEKLKIQDQLKSLEKSTETLLAERAICESKIKTLENQLKRETVTPQNVAATVANSEISQSRVSLVSTQQPSVSLSPQMSAQSGHPTVTATSGKVFGQGLAIAPKAPQVLTPQVSAAVKVTAVSDWKPSPVITTASAAHAEPVVPSAHPTNRNPPVSRIIPSNCANEMRRQEILRNRGGYRKSNLRTDGPGSDEVPASDDEDVDDEDGPDFECPRCEKHFSSKQKREWEDHTSKCMD